MVLFTVATGDVISSSRKRHHLQLMWHYIQQLLDVPLTAGETDTFFSTNSAI
jgi:hypothetical protein